MARLLLFCLINVISPTEAQDYPAPTLTVDPPIISEATIVTLNCQTPVQTPGCHFHLNRQYYESSHTCQTALSGAELLFMVKKRPPVKISVSCFYYHTTYKSADSDESIINIGLPPPSLTVTKSVITEKDRVIFHCRPPDSSTSTLCHFYTTNGQNFNNSKCRLTVRGSDLLMLNQIPPVEIQVQCYYVFVRGQEVSPSPHSENISLTVRRTTKKVPQPNPQLWPKPEITFEKYDDEVSIACSLPPAVTGSKCNLYFGESTQPYQTVKSQTKTNKIELFCQLYVPVNKFWTNLRKVQSPEVSCDYTLENGSSSPHSDGYNSRVFIAKHFTNPTPEIITLFDQTKTSTRPNHETTGDPDRPGKEAQPQETTASVTTVTTMTRTNHGTGSYFDSVTSGPKPVISLQFNDKDVLVFCTLPLLETGLKCNLYFGKSTLPYQTVNVQTSMKRRLFCQFSVSVMDLQSNISEVEEKQISCDFSLKNGQLSPRSDGHDSRAQPHETTAASDQATTTNAECVTGSDSETKISGFSSWLLLTVLCVCGLVLGCVLMVLGFFFSKRKKKDSEAKARLKIQNNDKEAQSARIYMPLEKAADVYATIHDQASAIPVENIYMNYSSMN